MTLSDRLRHALTVRNLSVSDMTSRVDISQAAFYFLLGGTTTPDKVRFSTIYDICKALRISPEWLMYGHGEMDAGRVPGQSHSLRITADIIRDAQAALRSMARIGGHPPSWEADPENLALAINTVIEVGTADGGNVIDLMAKIADTMRKGAGDAVDGGTNGRGDTTAVSSSGNGKPKA